ncbi:MAG: hypothetical protein QOC78_2947 [Solirubrobacteraceae bacterium]|jgi:hypothetical protein|nr:hypothetical protein [Solirubrobacteraceae bacterium]MEA2277987.1 hypothetical protein [Solirubrobacteraceae bacterium]
MDERDPNPTDDPRRTGTSDQNAEEGPAELAPRESDGDDRGAASRAPGTSHPQEGDPGQATGNPDAAG